MLQRDDRPGGLGRPSLFSEAPDAPGEDKNILKQLDGLLAASAPAAFWARWHSGVVAGMLALCAVVAGLVWTSNRDEPALSIAQSQPPAPAPAPAPVTLAVPSVLPATPSPAVDTAPSALAVTAPSTVREVATESAAPVSQKTVVQHQVVDKPHGRRHRHAARTGRDKPAVAADRHGHKARPGHAPATRAKVRGNDKTAAHAQQKTHGKRQHHSQDRTAGKHGTRGKAATLDGDAALIETVLTHGRATGVVQERARPGAGHCVPVKGKRADAGHHPTRCKTKTARNKAA